MSFILLAGMFMILAISAKIERDKQVITDIKIDIDHTSGYFFITEADVINHIKDLVPENGTSMHVEDMKVLEEKLQNVSQVEKKQCFC